MEETFVFSLGVPVPGEIEDTIIFSLVPTLAGILEAIKTFEVGPSAEWILTLDIDNGITPEISLVPSSLSFVAYLGGSNPPSQVFQVVNSGSGTLSWTAVDDMSWLEFTPDNGGNSVAVTCSSDITGLPIGIYSGSITVTDPAASNSPQTVSVTLTIIAVPEGGRMYMLQNYRDANDAETSAFKQSWVDAVVLSAGISKSYIVPPKAHYVIFKGTCSFIININDTVLYPSTDITDGTASTYIPKIIRVDEGDFIEMYSPDGGTVSMSLYR